MKVLPVLMYHQVCREGTFEPSEFIVGTATFHRQMKYLKEHGYFTPRLKDLLSGKAADSGKKPVLLTFDDGYLNTYENAFPILQEFGLRALVGIIADPSVTTNSWDASKGYTSAPLMRAEHIREMALHGVEFGSHSFSHKSLPGLGDEALTRELAASKEAIETMLGRAVEFLTYPYGDVDVRVKETARRVGYACAFATHTGPLHFHADFFEIRRTLVEDRADDFYLYTIFSGVSKALMWSKWSAKRLLGMRNRFQYEL